LTVRERFQTAKVERKFLMRLSARKAIAFVTLAAGGGYLLAGPGTGCAAYTADSIAGATDFCFIFDCQNGILGGTIDPCSNTGPDADQGPFLADCP
jgi:hypothetical protein